MERFFLDEIIEAESLTTQEKYISIFETEDSEYHHLVRVLRLKVDNLLEVVDKLGQVFQAKIIEICEEKKNKKNKTKSNNYLTLKILRLLAENRETLVEYSLFQGIAKNDKLDFILQKSCELGVKDIFLLKSSRVQGNSDYLNNKLASRLERGRNILKGAALQSKRNIIPHLHSPLDLTQMFSQFVDFDYVFFAYEDEEKNTLAKFLNNESIFLKKKYATKEKLKIAIIVGPEGGFSSEESAKMKLAGAISISLGKRILRTETASIVFLSQLEYALESFLCYDKV